MTTLRSAAYRFTPIGKVLSVRGLVSHLGLSGEISGRDLLRRLTPQSYYIRSGDLGPSTVTGKADLVVFSDGFWSYRGDVHESGLIGHDYVLGILLDYVDPNGEVYAYANDGTVHGLDIGSDDDSWQKDGWDQRISRNWDAIAAAGWQANLHVSTNLLAAVEAMAVALPVVRYGAAVVALVVVFVASPNTKFHWQATEDGQGVEAVWTGQY
ncbi:hypothetical protein ACIGXA_33895 [Streptomyces fildesensis]|uniref:Uncharacterized protein n=1 Tax=Streptomyces fildesensis TaxID=375757 RepID=A0ABW8CI88_9ACTN